MKLLIDTNVFIPLEPASTSDLERLSPDAARLLQVIQKERHEVFLHPKSRVDITRDKDESRRRLRMLAFNKYPHLASVEPFPCHWMNFSCGTSKAFPSALLNTQDGLISICLQINNVEDRLAIFNMLKQDQAAIESELGGALVWEEKPEKKEQSYYSAKSEFRSKQEEHLAGTAPMDAEDAGKIPLGIRGSDQSHEHRRLAF